MANLISFVILCVFLYGRSLWSTNLKWHIRLMLTAFAADLALVLALVMGRDALSKVDLSMAFALKIHVPIAVSTVALYVLTIHAGVMLYRGQKSARSRLRLFDKALTTLRILTFITSVWVQFAGRA